MLYQLSPVQAPQRSAGAGALLSYRVERGMPAANHPRTMRLKDWAQEKWVASEQDRSVSHQHPDLIPWSTELGRLGRHFVGSEYAPEEAGYLEGALCAVAPFLCTSPHFDPL